MKRISTAVILLLSVGTAMAQTPPALAVAKGDSVIILITAPPQPYYGFVIKGLRQDTVRPLTDTQAFASRLGSDYQAVLRATEADNTMGVMRKLQSDNFAANMLSIFFPSVGAAIARSWREGGHEAGSTARFHIEFLDARGRAAQPYDLQVIMVDLLPVAPTALQAKSSNNSVALAWRYPSRPDLAFGFNIYRASGSGAQMQKLNDALVLRDQNRAPSFIDNDIQPGMAIRYAVRALDLAGREGPGVELTVTVRDTIPPAPAARVTAEVTRELVRLVWPMAPEPDAIGYYVKRSLGVNEPYTRISRGIIPLDKPTFTDTTAIADRQYFYQVVTLDSARNESVPSNPENAFPLDRTPPSPPTTLKGTLLPRHRVSLNWLPSPSRDVFGYTVYRTDHAGSTVQLNNVLINPPFIDVGPDSVGLTEGRTYVYTVVAVDGAPNESAPATVHVKVPDDVPPAPGTGLNVQNVQGRYAVVRWSVSPAGDVKSYEVKRADRTWIIDRRAERIVTDSTIKAGNVYTYSLTAIDSAGNRGAAVADTFAFNDPTPPSAPRNAAARRLSDGVHVMWERVADNDVAGYLVFRSDLPTGQFTQITPQPVSALTFTDTAAPAEAFYQVRAVDQSKNRSASSPTVRAIQP
ncbi:MAG TPA: hypothetical protein VM100_05475 [Longimicrobiales bacterium]|nr:hypothetical protein [Longimicrobiales bacterium]